MFWSNFNEDELVSAKVYLTDYRKVKIAIIILCRIEKWTNLQDVSFSLRFFTFDFQTFIIKYSNIDYYFEINDKMM